MAVKILGEEELFRKFMLTDDLVQWIKKFDPEIIYCHIASLSQTRFVTQVIRKFDIPICIHIMDDWFFHKYQRGIFGTFLRREFHRQYTYIIKKSAVRMAIGKEMSLEYERRYGYPFIPFANAIDCNLGQLGK